LTLLGVWLGRETNQAHREAAAVREIRELGGRVQLVPRWPAFACNWVRKLTGEEHFGCDVLAVSLRNCNFSVHGLIPLNRLTRLKALYLDESNVTDDALAPLAALPTLETLSLRSTEVTDVGLAHLLRIRRLTTLDVSNTRVTPKAAARLEEFIPGLAVYVGSQRPARRRKLDF
jgi:hypothetical protein